MKELELGRRINDDQAVWLRNLRGDLRQMLGPRHADRDRKTEFASDPPPDRSRDLGRRPEEMRAARDLDESLVDRDPLEERGEFAEDGDGRVAEALIVAEVTADESKLRAQLARPPP